MDYVVYVVNNDCNGRSLYNGLFNDCSRRNIQNDNDHLCTYRYISHIFFHIIVKLSPSLNPPRQARRSRWICPRRRNRISQ
jgi:hypothetical protein